MYISAVKGAAPRQDDAAVMARLARCHRLPTEKPTFLALMNEGGEVCRLIMCGTEEENRLVRAALDEMGFHARPLAGTGYQDLAEAVFWKGQSACGTGGPSLPRQS